MYVDPILDYAFAIWSPYLVKHISKLESIQHFGTWFITGKYDKTCNVSALLRDLQLPRLELLRCQYNRVVLMYMIVNRLLIICIHSSLLIPVSECQLILEDIFIDFAIYLKEFYAFIILSSQLQLKSETLIHLQLLIVTLLNILDLCCTHMCILVIVNYIGALYTIVVCTLFK